MPNPNTFDEATAATEEMFANGDETAENVPPAENAAQTAENTAETAENTAETAENTAQVPDNAGQTVNNTTANTAENQQLQEAAQTAELAAQVASEKDGQLQQVLSELEELRKQNQQLQGTVDELSRRNEDEIIEEALTPPTLDINGLAFADEDAQRAAMAKFAEEMSAYDRQQIMQELSPALEFAKKGMREAETKDIVAALSQIPEISNIGEMLPQLNRIIENNKWLKSDDMPLDEKYINAYAMARGIDTINNPPAQPEPPKEPTAEELLEIYNNNPAFQELVEKQRIDTLKQSQQVPPFSASSGAVNAALNIQEKPQTLEEASERTRRMFGRM